MYGGQRRVTELNMIKRHIRFLHGKVTDMLREVEEISPEKEQIEVEAFPTEARMRQKARGKQHKLLTGEESVMKFLTHYFKIGRAPRRT